jgi:3-isopropylmalate/(R)-2-methylmalate dehydratase small subunit
MKTFTIHQGIAAPLLRDNIDTDTIIPSVEMKRVSRHGLSGGLFAAWRYTDRAGRIPDPKFVLNRQEYRNATILLTGVNFGCGSSREHAVWALAEYGIRAIIAVSFGVIFRNNCIANGVLPICLPAKVIAGLADHVTLAPQENRLTIDLEARTVTAQPAIVCPFEIPDSDAEMLLQGLDPVALTLRLDSSIRSFRDADRRRRPWVYL